MTIWAHIDICAALIRREIAVRFGQETASYLWAFIVPLSWIGFGILAFAAFDREIPISAPPALFLATGVLPYVVFRQTMTYITRSTVAARKLLDLPNVLLGHFIVSFSILEGLTTAAIAVLLFSGLTVLGNAPLPDNLGGILQLFAMTWLIASGAGSMTAIAALRWPVINRVLPLLLRPFFWISGVFFVASELPSAAACWLRFNPLFTLIDGVRDAYFLTYESPVFSPSGTAVTLLCVICAVLLISLRRTRPFNQVLA